MKLDLNDLRVESFDTTLDAVESEGIVFGQSGASNQCGMTSAACGATHVTTCCHLCTD